MNFNCGKGRQPDGIHESGVYENLPSPKRINYPETNKRPSISSSSTAEVKGHQNDLGMNYQRKDVVICSPTLSGGVGRSVRAKSEKREIIDTWFSKSFAQAGGLHQHQNSNENDSRVKGHHHEGDSGKRNNFENDESTNVRNGGGTNSFHRNVSSARVVVSPSSEGNGSGRSAAAGGILLPYRGSKTTSDLVPPTDGNKEADEDDWDFLTTLNDILREENFIGDSYSLSLESNTKATNSTNGTNSGVNLLNSTNVNVNVPLSPRPPRPARRAELRRKEFAKARSMDAAQFSSTSGELFDLALGAERNDKRGYQSSLPYHQPPPPPILPRPVTPNKPNKRQEYNVNESPRSYHHHERPPSRLPLPPEPPSPSRLPNLPPEPPSPLLMNAMSMSTSLDSIYDRLKNTTEYVDPAMMSPNNGRPMTQFYGGSTAGGYPNPMYYPGGGYGNFNNFHGSGNRFYHQGGGGGYFYHPEFGYFDNVGSNGYLHRQSGGGGAMDFPPGGGGGSVSMNNVSRPSNSGSLPRLWNNNMPEFRSTSFGSLKGSLLGLDYEERLLRLESDKETLHLQVSVLSDQIEAQTDKIKDLEKSLDDKKNTLETTEDQLQHELLSRSSLETQKLELLTEISSLRLKQASLERENVELRDKSNGGGKSLGDLTYLESGVSRVWDKPPLVPGRSSSPAHTLLFQDQRVRLATGPNDLGQPPPPNPVRTPPGNAYRRVDQSAFGTVPRRSPHSSQLCTFNGQLSTLDNGNKSKPNSLSSGNINVMRNFNNNGSAASGGFTNNKRIIEIDHKVPIPSTAAPPIMLNHPALILHHQQVSNVSNNTFYPSGQHPSAFRDPIVPSSNPLLSFNDSSSCNSSSGLSYFASRGSWFRKSRKNHQVCTPSCDLSPCGGGGSRSTSTPNLAGVDKQDWDGKAAAGGNLGGKSKESPGSGGHKSRGILRILGKLRRSNSGGLDNDQIVPLDGPPSQSFVRGGLRATAQPRLGWVKEPTPPKKPEGPVISWDSESVISWLNYLGLGMYAGEAKRWVKTGQQLFDASPQELDKELGLKNHFHRKKFILALKALKEPEEEDLAGKLDYNWVIRWLDDVGLPQYKESFAEARIDGRVLSYLTQEDLITLKVTSVLHHASIKRGIQLLRVNKFHPDCLCRRGGPTPGFISRAGGGEPHLGNNNGSNGSGDYGSSDGGSSGGNLWAPRQVATWTNHRVMEWLKAIDLAEYAPNLRGSGVHGALIIFEARFNSELMATLLSIPSNKSLLRRHLSLQINELVGKHIVQEKRTKEIAPDFIPINPTTKVKIIKKSGFPLRKKRLSTDFAAEELLCPNDLLAVYPFHSDSLGQLSSLDNSLEENSAAGNNKVSNI